MNSSERLCNKVNYYYKKSNLFPSVILLKNLVTMISVLRYNIKHLCTYYKQ